MILLVNTHINDGILLPKTYTALGGVYITLHYLPPLLQVRLINHKCG